MTEEPKTCACEVGAHYPVLNVEYAVVAEGKNTWEDVNAKIKSTPRVLNVDETQIGDTEFLVKIVSVRKEEV